MENVYGIPMTAPLEHLREYVAVLRAALWEGKVDYHGHFYNVKTELRRAPRTPILISALRDRAGYDVTIRWSDESHTAGLAPPAFLSLTRQAGNVWEGVLEGPAHRLVDFLAGRPVEELTIGRPDLESLFHRFYERGKGAGP